MSASAGAGAATGGVGPDSGAPASPHPTFDFALAADPAVTFVVVYHYPCPDGAMAALCASTALPAERTRWAPLAVYSPPAARASLAASLQRTDVVFVLDFSGGAPFLAAAAAAARAVVLIDHHKTVFEDLAALSPRPPSMTAVVDMGRSGCGLAADYFCARPRLPPAAAGALALVEDNDLWRHALPGSQEAAAGFAGAAGELDANARPGGPPALWAALAALSPDGLRAAGAEELRAQAASVAEDAAAAAPLAVPAGPGGGGGGGVPALRCLGVLTARPQYRSAAGNALAAASAARGLAAAAAVAYVEPGLAPGPAGEPLVKVSLRSVGDVDTTPLSRSWGGGGHANASSFNVARATWDAWVAAGAAGAGGGAPQ